MIASVKDKFLGAIMGTAVGDALGAPYEGQPRSQLYMQNEVGDAYAPLQGYPLGQYTDDTQMTLAIAESIIDCDKVDGEDIARRFARLWQTGEIVGAGISCSQAARNIMLGVSWREAGSEVGRAGNGTVMRVSPVGLWHYNSPVDVLKWDAAISSIITHKDKRSTAGAVVIAFCIAHIVSHERIIKDELIDQLCTIVDDIHPEFAELIECLPHWLTLSEDHARWEIAVAGWGKPEERLDFISPFVIPTVLICLYYFLKCPGDFWGNIKRVILAGGDVDTTAAITGALGGAYVGIGAIPSALVDGVLNSRHIIQVATRLWEAKQAYDKEREC